MGPNWCLLPPELLQFIAEKASSLGDYIRFRAVCHPWRSASSPRPRRLPIQVPWLMLPYNSYGIGDSTRLFYDLSASKIHRIDLPETRGAQVCGSSYGWLILHNGKVTSLFNPITRATISLPPYTAPPSHLGLEPYESLDGVSFFESWDPDKSPFDYGETFIVRKAILTSSPLDTSCMEDGDALLIFYGRSYDGFEREVEYTVYRLSNDGEPEWVEVTDVGQNVLFLSSDRHALSLPSANMQLPDLGANSLCYDSSRILPNQQQGNWDSWFNHRIKLARLDSGRVTSTTAQFRSFHSSRDWQKSLWLTPSLI
ncbi:hypothetical protein LUZ61_010568 [Rhynchospora tenuis]|uniref:KIB1-4 beta-propeller domain-containing protein n=1 Tax=Rhynchospora tenuis TaxID=198213 RepID=A0AAD5ZZJ7_9POAL|nr:hypothetical protein LUZ61_010568 [Rhynchospora tenuis]